MLNWDTMFASRASRMRASEIRELLKLLDRPDIDPVALDTQYHRRVHRIGNAERAEQERTAMAIAAIAP